MRDVGELDYVELMWAIKEMKRRRDRRAARRYFLRLLEHVLVDGPELEFRLEYETSEHRSRERVLAGEMPSSNQCYYDVVTLICEARTKRVKGALSIPAAMIPRGLAKRCVMHFFCRGRIIVIPSRDHHSNFKPRWGVDDLALRKRATNILRKARKEDYRPEVD